MRALAALNADDGARTGHVGNTGGDRPAWVMRPAFRRLRSTTNWQELPVVRSRSGRSHTGGGAVGTQHGDRGHPPPMGGRPMPHHRAQQSGMLEGFETAEVETRELRIFVRWSGGTILGRGSPRPRAEGGPVLPESAPAGDAEALARFCQAPS